MIVLSENSTISLCLGSAFCAFSNCAFLLWIQCTVHGTHKYFFLAKTTLKLGLTALFTHLKIILLHYFQFSTISDIQTYAQKLNSNGKHLSNIITCLCEKSLEEFHRLVCRWVISQRRRRKWKAVNTSYIEKRSFSTENLFKYFSPQRGLVSYSFPPLLAERKNY